MNHASSLECPTCNTINSIEVRLCSRCGENLSGSIAGQPIQSRQQTNLDLDIFNAKTVSPGGLPLVNEQTDPDATVAPYADVGPAHTEIPNNSALAYFNIEEMLGHGGMGTVYRAKDISLERNVAIKIFKTGNAAFTKNQPLLDEARLACQLNHPNIVTIYDVGRSDDSNFIVMEWVDGQTLDQLIPEQGFDVIHALKLAGQIVDGLVCAHQQGIIHRDIKPQNIMLNKEQRIKILDFGIANLLHQQESSGTLYSQNKDSHYSPLRGLAGTPGYMSPEQISEQSIDQRSDIFSLGIVLYQMLSGKRPFAGHNVSEIKTQFAEGNYMPIGKLLPHLPPKLSEIVDQCLAIDINKRWQTSTELSEHLAHLYRALTTKKNWWQKQHWLSKAALVLPVVMVIGWSINEVIFPPSTNELIARQVAEANKIALLPFDNISGDPLLQLFSDGLLTTLSNDLTVAGLEQGDGTTWVIPSNEIRRITDLSVKSVSDKFGVDLVLTGSVQHMGSTRSIELNLINARDGRQLKTISLSIAADKLFDGQSTVRQAVLNLLGWSIPQSLTSKFDAQRPQFDGSYKAYIEGNGYLYRFDLAGNLEKALSSFEKAIELDRKFVNAYIGLAETQLRYYRNSKDAVWLEKMNQTVLYLMELSPTNEEVDYLYAELLMQKGNFQDAIKNYSKSVDRGSRQIKALIGLAKANGKIGNIEIAEALYLRANKLSPNDWNLLADFGVFYFHNGFYQQALEQFSQLITISPNNDYGYQNVAAVYYSLDDTEKAIDYTKQAIALTPSADAYANLGTMYFYIKDYQKAIHAYEKAIELDDSSYMIWGNLADAYYLNSDIKSVKAYEKAARYANELLKVNNNDSIAKSHAAYYFASIGDSKQAIDYGSQITQQHTGWENFVVATAYDRLGLVEQTSEHLKIAIDKNYPLEEVKSTPLLKNCRSNNCYNALIEKN